jgi:hypothetical protein
VDRQDRGFRLRGARLNILVTGNGKSGSYKIRGEQLGKAIGADVIPNALDVGAYDVVVLVKKPRLDVADRCRRASVPLVYDVVDAWPQPEGNYWPRETCLSWLQSTLKALKPQGVIAATHAMALDCETALREIGHKASVLYLPHHARPGLERNPIREEVRTIGYEGAEHYLGKWRGVVERECERRGWRFLVNPASLALLDIVVALRDADGYAARTWKSNVKMANAQGSGTPFVGMREMGYVEQSCGVERLVDTEAEFVRALDHLAPAKERERVAGWMLTVAPRLESVAQTYRAWLESICA